MRYSRFLLVLKISILSKCIWFSFTISCKTGNSKKHYTWNICTILCKSKKKHERIYLETINNITGSMNKHIDILKTEVNHLRYWFILTCLSSYICDIFICKISKRFYNFFNFKCKKKLEHLTMAELRLNEQNIAVPNVSSIQQVLWSSQTGEGNLLFSVTIKLQYKLPHKLLLHLITYSIPTCMKVVPTNYHWGVTIWVTTPVTTVCMHFSVQK